MHIKPGDRVCDVHGSQWGTVVGTTLRFAEVIWDLDNKRKPRRVQIDTLRLPGERYPVYPNRVYCDPRRT